MSLTKQDLTAIRQIVREEVEPVEARLTKEIQKVGVEVVENRSVLLQHIDNKQPWKHD